MELKDFDEKYLDNLISRRFTAATDFDKLATEISKMSVGEITTKYGPRLGKGSARQAFRLSKGKVIKKSLNAKGVKQNDLEDEIANYSESRFLAKVFGVSEDGTIIISEFVPKVNKSKFSAAEKKKIGISLEKGKFAGMGKSEVEVISGEKWEFLANHTIKGMFYLDKGGVGFGGDFVRPSSWGYKNGRFILIDYGY